MNYTEVTSRDNHISHVNQSSTGMGAQVSRVVPAAKVRNTPARNTINAGTPVKAMVMRVFIASSLDSSNSNVCRQFSL